MKKIILTLSVLFLLTAAGFSQDEIPIGTWRIHASGYEISDVQNSTNRIVASGRQAIYIINKSQNEISVLNKLNGLSAANISAFAYDESKSILLIGYEDGNIDLVTNSGTLNFSDIQFANITGTKRINHVLITNDIAYLSSDFGVVVFDLQQQAIRETIRELGSGGTNLKITKAAILGDSIFLATGRGVLASRSDGTVNLLDFNNWKRFDQGLFDTEITNLEVFQDNIHITINNAGLFSYAAGNWDSKNVLTTSVFGQSRASAEKLMIIADDLIYQYDGVLTQFITDIPLKPNVAIAENASIIWIADNFSGLIKKQNATEERVNITGPLSDEIWSVQNTTQGIAVLRGGYTANKQAMNKPAQLSLFNKGNWINRSALSIPGVENIAPCNDLVALAETGRNNPAFLLSCFGQGVQAYDRDWNEFDLPQNPLGQSKVVALKSDADKVWIARYDHAEPLVRFNADGSFTTFSFPEFQSARFVIDLHIDALGQVWMITDPAFGSGALVFDPTQNRTRLINDQPGNGALPDNRVYTITSDRNGQVWIGTQQGVCFFPSPANVFNASLNAIRPIFENRFLLRDQRINTITVDGGNRKWIGSDNGVWLFTPDGESQLRFFDSGNSPLPANAIKAIAIEPLTGEVFFATSTGLASYRSDATLSTAKHELVKIFPNPVTGNYAGTVGISGLATDADVKITDISGKLVWQARANGGTATWNVRDLDGRRVGTGVYLVFSAADDGKETHVGKIAVVN